MNFFKSLVFLFILWTLGLLGFISKINFSKQEFNNEADAIIVLTGARGRIDAGIELLLAKKAKRLFISGVGKDTSLNDLLKNLSAIEKEKLEEANIYLGHFASSTHENALETANWVSQHKLNKIILVTSNYHMIRSLLEMERLMPEVQFIPYQVVQDIKFWKNFDNIKLIIKEYNKFLFSYVTRVF